MPKVIEITLYTFDELTDAAKEKTRDWYRESLAGDAWFAESIIDDAARMGTLMGFEFDSHTYKTIGGAKRSEPVVYWSLGYCQSDFACFEGRYAFAADAATKISAESGGTETYLISLADRLAKLPHGLTFTVKYHHYYGAHIDALEVTAANGEVVDATEEQQREVRGVVHNFNKWIYDRLREELDYQMANEQVDDAIRANGYTFLATGEREG